MRKSFLLPVIALLVVAAACNAKSQQASTSSDPVIAQAQKVAGTNATDCGRVAPGGDIKKASDCAMQASAAKKPFYVFYDLPGGEDNMKLSIGVAGNGSKLSVIEYSSKGWQKENTQGGELSASNTIVTANCPAELRVANSGRVTCFAPQQMPAGMGGANPHGGMGGMGGSMGGTNPHGGMGMPPAGTANPHEGVPGAPPISPKDKMPSNHPPVKTPAPTTNQS